MWTCRLLIIRSMNEARLRQRASVPRPSFTFQFFSCFVGVLVFKNVRVAFYQQPFIFIFTDENFSVSWVSGFKFVYSHKWPCIKQELRTSFGEILVNKNIGPFFDISQVLAFHVQSLFRIVCRELDDDVTMASASTRNRSAPVIYFANTMGSVNVVGAHRNI